MNFIEKFKEESLYNKMHIINDIVRNIYFINMINRITLLYLNTI